MTRQQRRAAERAAKKDPFANLPPAISSFLDHLRANAKPLTTEDIESIRRRDKELIDQVSEDDRAWFANNPTRRYRLREMPPDEFPTDSTHVLVTQIGPGCRIRSPLTFPNNLPFDSDKELERILRVLNTGRPVRITSEGHVEEIVQ